MAKTDPVREILLVVETAGAPEVIWFGPGAPNGAKVDLNPINDFRHHLGAAIVVGDIPALPGSWLRVGNHIIAIDTDADVVEVSFTESGWEEGLVAVDPMPVSPNHANVWQVPVIGWLSWMVLCLGLYRAVARCR
jgi:hypothetical protein